MNSLDMSSESAAAALPAFPMHRDCPYHPPAGYARLHAAGPLGRVRLYDGRVAWVVTGHAQARRLLTDPRLSSDRARPDFPVLVERMAAAKLTTLVGMDPPEHTARRRQLIPAFTVRRIGQLRPKIREVVDERIDALLRHEPPMDIVPLFALPVPSTVICHLLGVPYADHQFFEQQTQAMLRATATAQQAAAASAELVRYFSELIRTKRAHPTTGLLDELISDSSLPDAELAAVAMFLLVAGHETTANMLGLSILTLLEHPEQTEQLRRDPRMLPGAVEELLRFLSVADEIQRVAAADIPVGDQVIRAGDAVYLPDAALNRDGEVFGRPNELDVTRAARHHLAFGYGPHQCLGQNLARAELEIALGRLFDRVPSLALAAPLAELEVKPGGSVQGVPALPVIW